MHKDNKAIIIYFFYLFFHFFIYSLLRVECRDFLFFSRYGVFRDLLQYIRTAKSNLFVLYIKSALNCSEKIMFCCCVASSVMYTIIEQAQKPMKLLHLYDLLYNQS